MLISYRKATGEIVPRKPTAMKRHFLKVLGGKKPTESTALNKFTEKAKLIEDAILRKEHVARFGHPNNDHIDFFAADFGNNKDGGNNNERITRDDTGINSINEADVVKEKTGTVIDDVGQEPSRKKYRTEKDPLALSNQNKKSRRNSHAAELATIATSDASESEEEELSSVMQIFLKSMQRMKQQHLQFEQKLLQMEQEHNQRLLKQSQEYHMMMMKIIQGNYNNVVFIPKTGNTSSSASSSSVRQVEVPFTSVIPQSEHAN